jgi:hypothetical protein
LRITKSNLRGEFQNIGEQVIVQVAPEVVVVVVFAIVGLIFQHHYYCGCDDGLVNSEKSWHVRCGIPLLHDPEHHPLSTPEPPLSGGRIVLRVEAAVSVSE